MTGGGRVTGGISHISHVSHIYIYIYIIYIIYLIYPREGQHPTARKTWSYLHGVPFVHYKKNLEPQSRGSPLFTLTVGIVVPIFLRQKCFASIFPEKAPPQNLTPGRLSFFNIINTRLAPSPLLGACLFTPLIPNAQKLNTGPNTRNVYSSETLCFTANKT